MTQSFDYQKCFYQALKIRRVEDKIVELYPRDLIQSPVHLSIGQEHHIAALCEALGDQSVYFTSYRSHALYLARNGNLGRMFCELFGRLGGPSEGKAGSMHLCEKDLGILGASAVVGTILSHACGHAFAANTRKTGQLTVSVTGDGSIEEGTFFETLNMANLYRLPVLFVIEDNELAIETHRSQRQSFSLEKICQAFSIKYLHEDNGFAMDSVWQAGVKLRQYCLDEQRPAVYEVKTCRYYDHVGIHPMPESPLLKKWQARDPLIADQTSVAKHTLLIDQEISAAVATAHAAPTPTENYLLKDVYSE